MFLKKRHFRSVFISDVHLGLRWSQAGRLNAFLDQIRCDNLYLAGDIIDGWKTGKKGFLPPAHAQVLDRLLMLARESRVVYLAGNHDDFHHFVEDCEVEGIQFCKRITHQTVDGRRFLVTHGDEFDIVEQSRQWLSRIGAVAFEGFLWLDAFHNALRTVLGKKERHLALFLKRKAKNMARKVGHFEDRLASTARKGLYDGVICGHIHQPEMRLLNGVPYFNCGDWIHHCSALVENLDGSLDILRLAESGQKLLPLVGENAVLQS